MKMVVKEATEKLRLPYIEEKMAWKHIKCAFVFWINALQCVYVKQWKASRFRIENTVHFLRRIFNETIR